MALSAPLNARRFPLYHDSIFKEVGNEVTETLVSAWGSGVLPIRYERMFHCNENSLTPPQQLTEHAIANMMSPNEAFHDSQPEPKLSSSVHSQVPTSLNTEGTFRMTFGLCIFAVFFQKSFADVLLLSFLATILMQT